MSGLSGSQPAATQRSEITIAAASKDPSCTGSNSRMASLLALAPPARAVIKERD
jgi:hypothetical protein